MVGVSYDNDEVWETTSFFNGERMVSDFDLGLVYDTYEKYFTEFDRLRIMIYYGPYQKKYGYPYVTLLQFSRRELQEMVIRGFRAEDLTESYKVDEAGIRRQKRIRDFLQVVRMQEVMQEREILETGEDLKLLTGENKWIGTENF